VNLTTRFTEHTNFNSVNSLLVENNQENQTEMNTSQLNSGPNKPARVSRSSLKKTQVNSGDILISRPCIGGVNSAAGLKRLEIMKSQQELIEECKNSLNELIKASKWPSNEADEENRRKSESNRSLALFGTNSSLSNFNTVSNFNSKCDEDRYHRKSTSGFGGMKKSQTLINQTLSSLQQQPTQNGPIPSSVSTNSLSRDADFASCMHLFDRTKADHEPKSNN
jgi:hypothetical protein